MRSPREVTGFVEVARCVACDGPSATLLPRFEHDGKVDAFHDVCVGRWLMANPESVIFFVLGEDPS